MGILMKAILPPLPPVTVKCLKTLKKVLMLFRFGCFVGLREGLLGFLLVCSIVCFNNMEICPICYDVS